MEQITRINGVLYYGNDAVRSPDEAYLRFRDDYHNGLGKSAWKRLNRLGSRTERIHGFGFDFPPGDQPGIPDEPLRSLRIRMVLLGLVGISYCWLWGAEGLDDLTEEEYDAYIDWAFARGNKMRYVIGRQREKVGRTKQHK